MIHDRMFLIHFSFSYNSLDKAEDLCRKKKPKLAIPYLLKAIEDQNNLDAIIQIAFLMDRPNCIEALEGGKIKGFILFYCYQIRRYGWH